MFIFIFSLLNYLSGLLHDYHTYIKHDTSNVSVDFLYSMSKAVFFLPFRSKTPPVYLFSVRVSMSGTNGAGD